MKLFDRSYLSNSMEGIDNTIARYANGRTSSKFLFSAVQILTRWQKSWT